MFTTSTTDRTLTCGDCQQEFLFTASEQQFYEDRGFTEPRRCPACRALRKASRGGESQGSRGGWSAGSDRPAREMFAATCAACGRETQVPFRPSGVRPVYCSDCFTSHRPDNR
jgi:CxxC-x17-CxxC domain-containing protein